MRGWTELKDCRESGILCRSLCGLIQRSHRCKMCLSMSIFVVVLLVTIGWVVGPVLVLYLAGRAFTDCTRIAMGFWIVAGLRIGFCLRPCRSMRRTRSDGMYPWITRWEPSLRWCVFVEYDENVDPLVEWCADGLVSDWWM